MMIKVIEYISLFIWGTYFLLAIYREAHRTKQIDIFHLIRVDNIFFLAIYLIYNNFDSAVVVMPYLYLIICITSLVYLLYDIIDNYKFSKIAKRDYIYYIGGFLVFLAVLIYFIIWGKTIKVFTFTLILNIFVSVYVSIIKLIKKN